MWTIALLVASVFLLSTIFASVAQDPTFEEKTGRLVLQGNYGSITVWGATYGGMVEWTSGRAALSILTVDLEVTGWTNQNPSPFTRVFRLNLENGRRVELKTFWRALRSARILGETPPGGGTVSKKKAPPSQEPTRPPENSVPPRKGTPEWDAMIAEEKALRLLHEADGAAHQRHKRKQQDLAAGGPEFAMRGVSSLGGSWGSFISAYCTVEGNDRRTGKAQTQLTVNKKFSSRYELGVQVTLRIQGYNSKGEKETWEPFYHILKRDPIVQTRPGQFKGGLLSVEVLRVTTAAGKVIEPIFVPMSEQ